MRKRHGDSVVRGDGGRGYAIARQDFDLLVSRERVSLSERIDNVEETVREHDRRLDVLAREVSTLRRTA